MELKPVRIATAYSCLNNTAFIQINPGKCPVNGTDLVPITASMFFVCAESPDKHELNPGKCADGSQRVQRFEPRLHGDHNPRHGGQLFMADDGWHHVEGTYSAPDRFRVYYYDDWTRPFAPEGVTARAIVNGLTSIPLRAGDTPTALDARIPNSSLPLSISLRVRFKADEPEKLFDFTFKEYSSEPGEPPVVTRAPEPAPVPQTPQVASTPPVPQQPAVNALNVIPVGTFRLEPIPATAKEILAELNARSQELSEKIDQRAPLGEYWVPALRSKDLALALVSDHLNEIPAARRPAAENAVRRLLRVAYAIDNFGDLGDFEKIVSAHEEFVAAFNELRNACASLR
jgi:hypothetical protein